MLLMRHRSFHMPGEIHLELDGIELLDEPAKRQAFNPQYFISRFLAGHNGKAGFGDVERASEKFDDCPVGGIVDRRSRYFDF